LPQLLLAEELHKKLHLVQQAAAAAAAAAAALQLVFTCRCGMTATAISSLQSALG
jgi:hypothetical protein